MPAKEKENKAIAKAHAWIKSLPEAKQKAFAHVLKDDELAEQMGRDILAQGDYSRNMQEVGETREQLKQESTRLAEYKTQLDEWKTKNQASFNSAMKELADLRTFKSAAGERLKLLKATHGLSDEDVAIEMARSGSSAEAAAGKLVSGQGGESGATVGSAGDDRTQGNFVTMDDFRSELVGGAKLSAKFHKISARHQELFGSTNNLDLEELVDGAIKAGKPIEDYWAETFKTSEREAELAREKQEEHDRKLVEEAEQRVRSQMISEGYQPPGSSPSRGGGSPLFESRDGVRMQRNSFEHGEDNPLSRNTDPLRGVHEAVRTWQSGELRDLAEKGLTDIPAGFGQKAE